MTMKLMIVHLNYILHSFTKFYPQGNYYPNPLEDGGEGGVRFQPDKQTIPLIKTLSHQATVELN